MADANYAFCSVYRFHVAHQDGSDLLGREIWSRILRLQIESEFSYTLSPLFEIGEQEGKNHEENLCVFLYLFHGLIVSVSKDMFLRKELF